jgi:hypothetical protein
VHFKGSSPFSVEWTVSSGGAMTPESMFHQMLGLGDEWQVKTCQFDPINGLVTLHIEETEQL